MDRRGLLWGLCCCLLLIYGSCSLVDERDLCCEADTMRYRFLYHGEDCFQDCIYTMDYYLFDSLGYYKGKMQPDRDDLQRVRLDSLKQGEYTLVALGNLHDYGYLTSEAGKGLRNFRLVLDDYFGDTGAFDNGDPLYWGARTFTIVPGETNSFLTEMADIHCVLHVLVEWERLPEYADGYHFQLDGISKAVSMCDRHSLSIGVQQFPACLGEPGSMVQSVPLRQFALEDQLYTLRYTDDRIPVFRLWNRGETVTKDIDLGYAFRQWGWYPDRAAVQNYQIRIYIRADGSAEVSPGINAGINDWVDGGTIGF